MVLDLVSQLIVTMLHVGLKTLTSEHTNQWISVFKSSGQQVFGMYLVVSD